MYQTISERKQLARHLVGLDHKNNPVKRPQPPHIERLIFVSLIILLVLS
jgi:hypothetical protein